MNSVIFDKVVSHIENMECKRDEMDIIIDEIKRDP